MARRPPRNSRPAPARPFVLRHTATGWQVRKRTNWLHARELSILAPLLAFPDGTLRGSGVVTKTATGYTITP